MSVKLVLRKCFNALSVPSGKWLSPSLVLCSWTNNFVKFMSFSILNIKYYLLNVVLVTPKCRLYMYTHFLLVHFLLIGYLVNFDPIEKWAYLFWLWPLIIEIPLPISSFFFHSDTVTWLITLCCWLLAHYIRELSVNWSPNVTLWGALNRWRPYI